MKVKDTSDKYKILTDIEHVLLRPGMYIGSIKPHETEGFIFNQDTQKFELQKYTYNPGLLKMFDEIISNSVDEHKRKGTSLDKIEINIDRKTGEITIWDNGGIPVILHKEYKRLIPEFIFSDLKAGSNFDDSEERNTAGTNGVGASLSNIFSSKFIVETADGKKQFHQMFSDNMHKKTEPKVKPSNKSFTQISYIADYKRFGLNGIDDITYQLIEKRVIDLAGCNQKIKFTFCGKKYHFKSFKDYTKLYSDNVIFEENQKWKIGVAYSDNSFRQVSFVNGVETKDGGTHVDYILGQINSWLREKIKKKHKVDVKPSELRNYLLLFVDTAIVNSSFSSQTKEKLITEVKDFGSTIELSEKFMKSIFESEIIKSLLDWIEQKQAAEERKQLRNLNKNLDKNKVLKLIDAKGKNREKCTLALFEGQSAANSFREYRTPEIQGAYPLRGKFINVNETPNSRLLQNQEVKDILAAVGLKFGEEPKDLRYGKILLYCDADHDGDSIASLLINFFMKFWPELFDEGRIVKVITPLLVAKKGKEILSFYTDQEFLNWQQKNDVKKWEVEYKKGLAALEDKEYKEIIENPRMIEMTRDTKAKENLEIWFGGDADLRKTKILG